MGKILSILKKWTRIMSFKALVIFGLILIPTISHATDFYSFRTGTGGREAEYITGGSNATDPDATKGVWFTPSTNYTGITRIRMIVEKNNSPTDDLELVIYSTTDGATRGTELYRSYAISPSVGAYPLCSPNGVDSNGVPISDGCFTAFDFSSSFTLSYGSQYLLMLERTGSYNPSTSFLVSGAGSGTDAENKYRGCNQNGSCVQESSGRPVWMIFNDEYIAPPTNTSTRIIDFDPQDNSTTTSPVNFNLHAYINPDDLTSIKGIKLSLHNIDQNVILLGSFSPSDLYLFEGNATSSGDFYFSTSTPIGDGNYRLEACIERTYFWGWIINIFSSINDCQSHQFIVGEETFIGHISQSIWDETQAIFASSTATSTAVLAGSCNPLGDFSITNCMAFLFIPDGQGFNDTMKSAREGILSRVPWGYLTRTYYIINNSATSSLPAITSTIQIGPGNDETPETTELTFDIDDMVAGGGALINSIEDPIHGQSFRDVFYPIVQLTIALAVLLTIIADVTSSHIHAPEGDTRKTKLS